MKWVNTAVSEPQGSQRREFLQLVGSAGIATLAGCSSLLPDDPAGQPTPTDPESPTAESTTTRTADATAIPGEAHAKIVASDGRPADQFGTDAALNEGTAIVGAWASGSNGSQSGAAYVFERSAGGWEQTAKLVPDDGDPGDWFGASVAIDGDTVLIGARRDEDPNGKSAGAAYAFERSAGGWEQTAKLAPDTGAIRDEFGTAISLDGDIALIGALRGGSERSGSAYVFERTTAGWNQQAELVPATVETGGQFGTSVAVDDGTALIGSWTDSDPNGTLSGSAYAFARTGDGWTQEAKIVPDDGDQGDVFGASVALAGDRALVGAYGDEDPNYQGGGSAYVFERSTETWDQVAKLFAADGNSRDWFGAAVALEDETAVIGAPQDENPEGEPAGSAYVFRSSAGEWDQQAKHRPDDSEPRAGFGVSVSIADDTALVGAYGARDDSGSNPGSAYLIDL